MNARLGPFELVAPLAEGGMGSVWRARYVGPGAVGLDPQQVERVALKVMTPQSARDGWYINAFQAEVRAVARLDHPNVLTVLDQGVVSRAAAKLEPSLVARSPWLAMPLVGGGTLDEVQIEGFNKVFMILDQLLAALAHAHANGVIHRDLKPKNVLFDEHSQLKLADFGLAHLLREGGDDATVIGTPAYMAPEQFIGDPSAFGPWTDLYALGGLAWRMLCGSRLYSQMTNPNALRQAHLTWPLPTLKPLVVIPPGVEEWLSRLLAKAPQERYSSAFDAREALHRCLRPDIRLVSEPPLDWARPPGLSGTGLGLYGLRPPPFTGRRGERRALWARLGQVAAEKRSQVIVLAGPAGTGKSRLAHWLCSCAHQYRGLLTHQVGADGLKGWLARSCGWRGDIADLRDHLDEKGVSADLREALMDCFAPTGPQPPALRHATLRRWLRSLHADRPGVLWLDDLMGDGEAIALLHTLLDDPLDLPLLVVATLRQEDLADRSGSAAAAAALLARDGLETLTVGPLPPSDHAELVDRILGLGGELASQITHRTAGNPLFAVQLIGDWAQRGLLIPGREGFCIEREADLSIPRDLGSVWAARTRSLQRDPSQWTALLLCACLGPRVDRLRWSRACSESGVDLGHLEQSLLDMGLALPADGGLQLVHGMLREQLLEEAGEARPALHRACARSFTEREPGDLGYHLLEAGQREEARSHLREALEHALHSGDLGQAQTLYALHRRSLDGYEGPEAQSGRLLWGRLALLQGRIDQAREELSALCAALAGSDEHLDLRAEVLAEAALAAWRGSDPDAVLRLAEEAEAVAQPHTSLRARCREVRARVLTDRGQLEEASATWAAAASDYEAAGDEAGQAMCSLGLGWVETTHGNLERAQTLVEVAVEVFDRLGVQTGSGVARNLLGEIARARGQLELAEENYLGARRRLRAAGALVESSTAALNLALVHLERGDLNRARLRAEQASSELRVRGAHQFQAAAHLLLATCAAAAEDWSGWDRRLAAARAELDRTAQVHGDIAALAARAARTAQPQDPARAALAWELAIQQWTRLERAEEVAALLAERASASLK